MQDLLISKEVLGDAVDLVTVSGTLDAHTFEALEAVVNSLLEQERLRVVVDMSAVDYVSSAGVGVLIAAANELEAVGGKLVLLNPSQNVCDVLDVLGLAEIFTTAASREDALAEV